MLTSGGSAHHAYLWQASVHHHHHHGGHWCCQKEFMSTVSRAQIFVVALWVTMASAADHVEELEHSPSSEMATKKKRTKADRITVEKLAADLADEIDNPGQIQYAENVHDGKLD
eukprot:12230633-Karenia_brevis.AAC.1